MLCQHELMGSEWRHIADLLLAESIGKQGHPHKNNRIILNRIRWIVCSGVLWSFCRNVMARGKSFTAIFGNELTMKFLIIFSMYRSLKQD